MIPQRFKLTVEFIKRGKILDCGSEWNNKELHNYIKDNSDVSCEFHTVDFVGDPTKIWDLDYGIPCDKNEYDSIIAEELIEHLLNPYQFLKECYRVLVPGGRLIVTVPNAKCPKSSQNDREHYFGFWMDNLLRLLETAGFNFLYFNYIYGDHKPGIFLKLISSRHPSLKPLLFIVAEKSAVK